jgi:uncharacterized protein with HEPN domain
MPSRPTVFALFDIRDNARLAQQFVAGLTPEAFASDRRTFYAVTRCLEIISEASRRLPQELRDRYPDLPWRAIRDVGNVYRHEYDNVAEEAVWRAVQERLPALLAVVESEIAGQSGIPVEDISDMAAPIPDGPEVEEDAPTEGRETG